MGYRSATQIILAILAVVLIVSYVMPKFEEIGVLQEEIAQYQEAVEKATQFNERLDALLTRSASFPQQSVRSLEIYLPQNVDTVAVARDLNTIAVRNNLSVESMVFENFVDEGTGGRVLIDPQETVGETQGLIEGARDSLEEEQFSVSLRGGYQDFKLFLKEVEQNAYPLAVEKITFANTNIGNLYTFEVVVTAYALNTQK